jgi:hypothetical protein
VPPAVGVFGDDVAGGQLALARARHALRLQLVDARRRSRREHAAAPVDQLDVDVGRRQRRDVVRQPLQRHLGRQDALAAAERRIERDRQHHVRDAHRTAQEDRPDALARRQRRAQRGHQPHALDVGRAHRFVIAQRLVAGRIVDERGLAHERAVFVEHRHGAEVVALVIDQLQELEQRLLRRRRVLAGTRQVEDARVDTQDRQQIVDVAGRVASDLLGDRQLVLLQRAAQRALADAQRRITRDGDGQRRDGEREQGQLGQQPH